MTLWRTVRRTPLHPRVAEMAVNLRGSRLFSGASSMRDVYRHCTFALSKRITAAMQIMGRIAQVNGTEREADRQAEDR